MHARICGSQRRLSRRVGDGCAGALCETNSHLLKHIHYERFNEYETYINIHTKGNIPINKPLAKEVEDGNHNPILPEKLI